MNTHKILIAGNFKETSEPLDIFYPYNGEIIGRTFKAGEDELNEAISSAVEIKRELQMLPAFIKSEILISIAQRLKERREEFARTITFESGKPIRNSRIEVDRSISIFTVAAEEAKRLPKEYMSIDWTKAGKGKEGLVKYFPVGIVGGISPFNFPLNLAVHKIAPAIAAGCPIILKPSSTTPLSTLLLAEIIAETDLPKGALSVLPMDRNTGNLLVTDERINLISFTGSPEIGWKMKEQSGKKKVVLELGGNAGVIVSDECNIEDAVKKCVVSAFSYSGQTCIHAQRIFIQEKIFDEFAERFLKGIAGLVIGDPMNDDTDMSVMIDEKNAIRVEEWVKEAVEKGAKILTGGERVKNLYKPTVLTNTDNTMKVCNMEVFGPTVVIESYKTIEQAVDMINDTRFGLQAGVFTNRVNEMWMAFNEIEAGGVIHNDVPTFRVDHMPYGGIKDSGFGREGVKYAIYDMMEPRILVTSL